MRLLRPRNQPPAQARASKAQCLLKRQLPRTRLKAPIRLGWTKIAYTRLLVASSTSKTMAILRQLPSEAKAPDNTGP
jgi:hypothetical protein